MRRLVIGFLLGLALASLASAMGCTAMPSATPSPPLPSPVSVSMTPRATLEATPTSTWVSISDIKEDPEAFRDRLVRMQGYGVIVATVRLCPGYVGQDRRSQFVDAAGDRITAEIQWTPSKDMRLYDPDHLRVFEGFIRIFSGEIGCPGAIQVETFPYFEITGVR